MKLFDKVVIVNPDPDTQGVGLLFDVGRDDKIEVVAERATEEDLRNPRVLCIEAGGDGEVHFLNFDHHAKPSLPSATYQARQYLRSRGKTFSPTMERIVSFIHLLDSKCFRERGWKKPKFYPSLVDIDSGIASFFPDLRERLIKEIEFLRQVEQLGLDPFGRIPIEKIPSWRRYAETRKSWVKKAKNIADSENIKWDVTNQGRRLAIHQGTISLVLPQLFKRGARVIVHFQLKRKKFTIVGDGVRSLLPILSAKEKEAGWGGHGRIIASSRGKSSSLTLDEVIRIVKEQL